MLAQHKSPKYVIEMTGEVIPELKAFVLSGSCSQLKQSVVTWLKENTVGGKISCCLFVVYCNSHWKIIVCVTFCCHGKSESVSV